MNYFLVDYENIGFSWMNDDIGIREGDTLVVFYSEQRKGLSLDEMDHLLKLNVIIRLEKVTVGSKNALDFQLTTYLGYLIGTHLKSSNFHIISNDKGFDAVCEYWRREQYFVDRIGNQQTEATNNTNAQNNKKRSLDLQDEIQRYMGNSSTV